MASDPKKISNLRKHLETAFNIAEIERNAKLHQQRLALARSAVFAIKSNKITDSVSAFRAYLYALEQFRNVSEGELDPTHFSLPEDVIELMTLSGVYWELVILYDRTNSPDRYRDFLHYMDKFTIFSKGMPFQSLCAETLRKYIRHRNPVHKKEFKQAYEIIGESQCFIASSLVDLIEESTLQDLRRWRDEYLNRSKLGRSFVSYYKKYSPKVARELNSQPLWIRKIVAQSLDQIARVIQFFLKK